jgi:ketosteroid isomerase-like protein
MPDELRSRTDRETICGMLIRFARALDEKDWTGYAALYAEDCTLDTSARQHSGRAGLAEFVEADLAGFAATHHVSAAQDITIDGDTAQVRSSLHATHVRSEDRSDFWAVGGWYDTTLRRAGDGWEITSVAIHPVWVFDTASGVSRGLDPGLQPPAS